MLVKTKYNFLWSMSCFRWDQSKDIHDVKKVPQKHKGNKVFENNINVITTETMKVDVKKI